MDIDRGGVEFDAVLFLRARAPPKKSKKSAATPEDRPTFLEGSALKPIAPQAKIAKRTTSREESLAREAALRGKEAEKDERAARRKLEGEEE